jgi:hypothetical protein
MNRREEQSSNWNEKEIILLRTGGRWGLNLLRVLNFGRDKKNHD